MAMLKWSYSQSELRLRPLRTKTAVCGPSTRLCGQRTEIRAHTVHLMVEFGRWTKIIILRWTSGRIFDHGSSISWTDSESEFRTTDHDYLSNLNGGGWWTNIKMWTDGRNSVSSDGQALWYFQVMDCENLILAFWNSAEPYALKLFNLIDHNSDFSQFGKVWEIIQQETTFDLKPFPSQK